MNIFAVFAAISVNGKLPNNEQTFVGPWHTTSDINDEFNYDFELEYDPNLTVYDVVLFEVRDHEPIITNDGSKFKMIYQVKGWQNLLVMIKGRSITVEGHNERVFSITKSLPNRVKREDVTAELASNGYLIISAPIGDSGNKMMGTYRMVPITETGKPY